MKKLFFLLNSMVLLSSFAVCANDTSLVSALQNKAEAAGAVNPALAMSSEEQEKIAFKQGQSRARLERAFEQGYNSAQPWHVKAKQWVSGSIGSVFATFTSAFVMGVGSFAAQHVFNKMSASNVPKASVISAVMNGGM